MGWNTDNTRVVYGVSFDDMYRFYSELNDLCKEKMPDIHDPNQIQAVRDAIKKIGATKTILLSTHILQEVRAVASRVVFVSDGRVVFDGPTAEFGSTVDDFDRRFRELTSKPQKRYLD